MTVRFPITATAIICLTVSACAPTQVDVTGEVRRAGIFTVAVGTSRLERQTPQEKIDTARPVRFVDETRDIPAILGTSFGLELVVSSNSWRSLTRVAVVMTNPPITNPTTGESLTRSGYTVTLPDGEIWPVVYTFHEAWEIAPGAWTIQVFHDEKLLVSEQFNVVAP